VPSVCNIVHYLRISLLDTMFWPNWSSSGVQVVIVMDSAAHHNVVFLLL
jgi:hypothetical protein